MRGPSIQKTAAASVLLHLTILVLSVVLINFSKNVVMPSPYTVSLVSPENSRKSGPPAASTAPPETRAAKEDKPVKDSTAMPDAGKKDEQKRLDDRISELSSKKKIERIVKLRSVISVKAGGTKSPDRPSKGSGATSGSKGTLFDSYYVKITEEIRQEWIYPDMGNKQLEAVVSVLISRDGTITVQGIEKSSGDLLFDRSALKAVTKASPVSPPPYEMEIGIRFYP
jgi:colicin import membrane protein